MVGVSLVLRRICRKEDHTFVDGKEIIINLTDERLSINSRSIHVGQVRLICDAASQRLSSGQSLHAVLHLSKLL